MVKQAALRTVRLPAAQEAEAAVPEDHFTGRDGLRFAGTHLLIDVWGASRLSELAHVKATLTAAVGAVGATLLHLDLHHFQPEGGISGVAVLAESHMSIHTWPERGYAALDVFVCGDCDAYKAIPVLREAFAPASIQLVEHKRGLVP
ncbi:MAG TPA: adenosylmethionine decarboxylase [Candidatus Sulfotelmatobacter sp.]|nr:adenosylmethionine decarboxylase [Candidatus Sulfotelmatobacter sp.]